MSRSRALLGLIDLARLDLEEIVSSLDERFYVSLGTTGIGLTKSRASGLRDKGLFAVGISLGEGLIALGGIAGLLRYRVA